MNHHDQEGQRKRYYVAVGAGQVLEDSEAAAYELVIEATEEEKDGLKALFAELSSMDEAQMAHFHSSPYGSASLEEINRGYEGILKQIYALINRLGTEETKQHITSMKLDLGGLQG
ncbi:hypothetical protein M3223_05225 [Paenibacillus pasadenensis]|uniref:hypothetical protein n=1 Tax=Paenibacillus pasadenensis TaxID=217090 RepID=UPI00203D9938|nr:hypothetical protein [Paenibacillus pasadenensis]MCM3746753.1 hypothetical protein [Paenibacillus pasadenensis]